MANKFDTVAAIERHKKLLARATSKGVSKDRHQLFLECSEIVNKEIAGRFNVKPAPFGVLIEGMIFFSPNPKESFANFYPNFQKYLDQLAPLLKGLSKRDAANYLLNIFMWLRAAHPSFSSQPPLKKIKEHQKQIENAIGDLIDIKENAFFYQTAKQELDESLSGVLDHLLFYLATVNFAIGSNHSIGPSYREVLIDCVRHLELRFKVRLKTLARYEINSIAPNYIAEKPSERVWATPRRLALEGFHLMGYNDLKGKSVRILAEKINQKNRRLVPPALWRIGQPPNK